MMNCNLRVIASLVLLPLLLSVVPPACGECHFAGRRAVAAADGGISVMENKVSYSFAQQMTFTLKAVSDTEISKAYLFFSVAGSNQTESATVEVKPPAREVNVNHVHDLRNSRLQPFATVTFWWQLESPSNDIQLVEPQQFQYTDNRFNWKELSANGVTVHWIEGQGDPIFGQVALDVAQASLKEINAELRVPTTPAINIYIYDAQHNLEQAMRLTGRSWVVGQAHPELGNILVAIPFGEGYMSQMRRYIPHEITHLLVYRHVTPDGYRYVPEWLDEGLATANEQLPTPEQALVLEEARTQGRLLSLEDLCAPFPPKAETTFLAYAQSGSLVRFIREQYGAGKIRDLLAAYADGASCAGGVQEALNTSLSDLEATWRASLEPRPPWYLLVERIGTWVGLWMLSVLLAVPMIGGLRRR